MKDLGIAYISINSEGVNNKFIFFIELIARMNSRNKKERETAISRSLIS